MKKSLLLLLVVLLSGFIRAVEVKISSPDNKLVVLVDAKEGTPFYSVTYNDKEFLKQSPLGLNTNIGRFSQQLSMGGNVERNTINESYRLEKIKRSNVTYTANEAVITFNQDNRPVFDLIIRVSNHDIAFRYKIYPKGETAVCVVNEELTGFALPQGTTTFLCPQMQPMTGFARTAPSYETSYTTDDEMGKNGRGFGYTFPALFKVNNNGWVLISETGVDGSYCASHLNGHAGGLYSIAYPMPEENNGNGSAAPGISLPGYTPWRTITVGETLAPIVETTIAFDVVKPKFEALYNYKYTKGSWSWIMKMDENTVFDVQKEYIDFSAAMGWETILVDALWDTQIGHDKIEELANYGKSKGVGLYLWYNSNGYWNDAPQGPRGIMDKLTNRRKEMAWMQRIGVKGIKVDFFGGDKQATMQLYEDILHDANDFGLSVIFHGCTLPRGWERMYPNYIASEAVLASEMLHFSQDICNNEAYNASIHPFIRNTVGAMDFGGSALNEYWNATNEAGRGSKRLTSDVFELATAVLFQSSVQHFALAPNNLSDAPSWAVDFMRNVPTTWDETVFVDGYPGKYVVLARRKGDKWYVAGINAENNNKKMKVSLPMIKAGSQLQVYSDNVTLQGSVKSVKLSRNNTVDIQIPKNGGFVIVAD
ncbi:MAG TPA: glycoside hydrolase family 97 catalytic domain-containing protein [Paludibacter sp.]|nr:glycoside hydrolase family 97 catalytic domain-containing protein [Paludibacter sp.]